ncbi:MAG: hypothetical protein HY080_07305 [Gammaproteobacteria bacterium]|nr:hypothetical protein [Gammaproteobacteria bacterium]
MNKTRRRIRDITRFLLVGYAALCAPAYALSQNGITVTLTGAEGNGSQAYIGLSPNPNGCLNNGIYFINPGEVGKTLAIAVAAKLSGKTVRIDFTQPGGPGTQCNGYGIYIE